MTRIQVRRTEEDSFLTYCVVNENDIPKLKSMSKRIFIELGDLWYCKDMTFRFKKNKEIITEFRMCR